MKKFLVATLCMWSTLCFAGGYPWAPGQILNSADLNTAFAARTTYSLGTLNPYAVLVGNGTGDIRSLANAGISGQVLTSAGAGFLPIWANGATVTSVSVVSANGIYGSVATATTTPAITLGTSITGIIKGNGTAILAATQGTDYLGGNEISGGQLVFSTNTPYVQASTSAIVATNFGGL